MSGTTGGTMDGAWQTMSGTCPMGHTGWPRIGPAMGLRMGPTIGLRRPPRRGRPT